MRTIKFENNIIVEIPQNYVIESMFFHPRDEKTKYSLRKEDKYLTVNIDKSVYTWQDVPADDVDKSFNEVLTSRSDIVLLAVPLKFEFDEDAINWAKANFHWFARGLGFGEMSFDFDKEASQTNFNTECMNKETTRKMLHDFVDHIIDTGNSNDWS